MIHDNDSASETDPEINEFLAFLAKDLHDNPGSTRPVNSDMVARVRALVADVEVDLGEPLDGEM